MCVCVCYFGGLVLLRVAVPDQETRGLGKRETIRRDEKGPQGEPPSWWVCCVCVGDIVT